MKYKDQFTPAQLESDFSYDGLKRADKGGLIEHLAPLGYKEWRFANSGYAMDCRIKHITGAIRKAQEMAKLNDN